MRVGSRFPPDGPVARGVKNDECVAQAARAAGHTVRIVDLRVFSGRALLKEIADFRPEAVGFSLNYLANVPEVVDLAKTVKRVLGRVFVFTGGHSASFIADEILAHADGAIDAVVAGEGEVTTPAMLQAYPDIDGLPGVVSLRARGGRAPLLETLDRFRPARDLTRRRRKYFIGELDPCASNRVHAAAGARADEFPTHAVPVLLGLQRRAASGGSPPASAVRDAPAGTASGAPGDARHHGAERQSAPTSTAITGDAPAAI
jgi:hypothetical protein